MEVTLDETVSDLDDTIVTLNLADSVTVRVADTLPDTEFVEEYDINGLRVELDVVDWQTDKEAEEVDEEVGHGVIVFDIL